MQHSSLPDVLVTAQVLFLRLREVRVFACVSRRHAWLCKTARVRDYKRRLERLAAQGRLACASSHSVALRNDGRVVTWGDQSRGQRAGAPSEAGDVMVACGMLHSCAVHNDGRVVTWGNCEEAQRADAPTDAGFVAVACGWLRALRSASRRRARGHLGQQRLATEAQRAERGRVSSSRAWIIRHGLALHKNCRVVMWGHSSFQLLTDAPTDTGYVVIGCCYVGHQSIALRDDGRRLGQRAQRPPRAHRGWIWGYCVWSILRSGAAQKSGSRPFVEREAPDAIGVYASCGAAWESAVGHISRAAVVLGLEEEASVIGDRADAIESCTGLSMHMTPGHNAQRASGRRTHRGAALHKETPILECDVRDETTECRRRRRRDYRSPPASGTVPTTTGSLLELEPPGRVRRAQSWWPEGGSSREVTERNRRRSPTSPPLSTATDTQ